MSQDLWYGGAWHKGGGLTGILLLLLLVLWLEVCLNRSWARELMKPSVWEILAGVPYQPLLVNIFRRASSYCYREVDAPSPYVSYLCFRS